MSNKKSYIGCKISLITTSNIRYEGILCTIGNADSSIALAKAYSFGTEDRLVANPISPQDTVFDYIVFKASEIKDLILDENLKKVSTTNSNMSNMHTAIGKKIAIITKSNVRYEGILQTIDAGGSSFSLSKVRRFGTEDRSDAIPVPPCDKLLESISFKTDIIKHTFVFVTPKAAATCLTYGQIIVPVFENPPSIRQMREYDVSSDSTSRQNSNRCTSQKDNLNRNSRDWRAFNCSQNYREFNHSGNIQPKQNYMAATGEMQRYSTCAGVFVRKEDDICIIWTKEYNHIYVKKENFDKQIPPCLRIQVDVNIVERLNGQYRYEGNNCRPLVDTYYAHIDNTFYGGEFSEYQDLKGRRTLEWRGIFELLRETVEGGGYIRSVRLDGGGISSPPCFIDKAFIPKPDRDQVISSGFLKFEGSVMLYYFAEPNVCPWKWISCKSIRQYKPTTHNSVVTSAYHTATQKTLEMKQRKQLNACLVGGQSLKPGSSIFVPAPQVLSSPVVEKTVSVSLIGYCLFADEFFIYFYCCETEDSNTSFGRLLKVSNRFRMQFGEWYRLVLTTDDVVVNPIRLPDDCIETVDWIPAISDEPIFLADNNGVSHHGSLIAVRAHVYNSPTFGFFSQFAKLNDPNNILPKAAENCPAFVESGHAIFVVEVSATMMEGFVVNRCFGLDRGSPLETYVQLAAVNTGSSIQDNSPQCSSNRLPENPLHCMQQPMVISDDATQNVQVVTHNEPVEPSTISGPSIEIPAERCSSDLQLNSCAVKGILNQLFSDKLKVVVENEGLKSTLDDLICCMGGVIPKNVAGCKHAGSSIETSHNAVSSIGHQSMVSGNVNQVDQFNENSASSHDQFPNVSTVPLLESPPKQGLNMNSDSIKGILNHLLSDNLKAIIADEGMKSALDDIVCCIDGSSMKNLPGNGPTSSSSESQNYQDTSILHPQVPTHPQEEVPGGNAQTTSVSVSPTENALISDVLRNVLRALQSPRITNIIEEEGLSEDLRRLTK